MLLFPVLLLARMDSFDINKPLDYTIEEVNYFLAEAVEKKDTLTLGDCSYWLYLYHRYNSKGKGLDKAMEYFLQANSYYDVNSSVGDRLKIRIQLADLLLQEGYFHDALKNRKEILDYMESQQIVKEIPHAMSSLADVYIALGDTLNYLDFILKATQLANEQKDSFLLAINYTNIGTFYLEQGNYEKAITYSRKAVPIALKFKPASIGWSICLEAVALRKMKKYEAAIAVFKRGIPFYKNEQNSISKTYCDIASCYESLGNQKQSLFYYKKCKRLSDSILISEKNSKVNDLILKYDKTQNENEILQLEKKNNLQEIKTQRLNRLIALLVIGLIFSLLLYLIARKFYRQKAEQNQIIAQQEQDLRDQKIKVLEQTMETKAVRAILDGQEEERKRMARELHDGLGGLLSALRLQLDALKNKFGEKDKGFDSAIHMVNTSVNEVRTIARHALPEALVQMGLIAALNDFLNQMKVPDSPMIDFQYYGNIELNQEQILVVYRVVQELVNNALKYAKASEIMVLLVQDEETFSITVEDDGMGFDLEKIKEGSGMKTLRHRCQFLKGNLLIDARPNQGASFHIQFPI